MKKKIILAAVLGILLGAGTVLTVDRIRERTHLLRTQYLDWRKVNLVLECIDNNYVDTVDVRKVSDAAIASALQALDPHSVYMPPVELEESETDLAGEFEGIGIQFNVPNDTAIVIEVIPGGPSEKIGVRQGDRLLKVDDTVIAGVGFPQDSMVRKMRGPAGTKVTVTVGRESEVIPFEITRAKIPVHSLDAAFMVNDTTAYLRLGKFSRTTADEFTQAAVKLLSEGMTHAIVDLRNNSGGFLDQALLLSNMFLPKGAKIVYMEGLHRKREDYVADGRGILQQTGLTVLINDGSASSSEIFAGAMQDNGRATIVGRRSFGKGLVQEPFNFNDGSGLRITVARFYTPSGRCIQKPYAEDYNYEVYKRYGTGEMEHADSMKLENGGIVPDVFVAVDTTRASEFYLACNRKAVPMRFASAFFDTHRQELSSIDSYGKLLRYLDSSDLEAEFLRYAKRSEGLVPTNEWASEKDYMLSQVRALVGRYSRLGDNAFYHLWLGVDEIYQKALSLL